LRAEVYTVGIFLGLVASWRSLVALRTGRRRDLLVAGFFLGLALAGHLAFAPLVAVLGLALAWRMVKSEPGPSAPALAPIASLAGLGLAFVAGLAPYLYIVWVDAHHPVVDYFDLVMQVKNPLALPRPDFDTPWKHLLWLLTGRNNYPPESVLFHPRIFA